ncbi:MAG: (Fe-S)-binding protein [Candidatus Brocadiia bacterium]
MEEKKTDFKKALAKLDALLDGKMSVYMNACVHCGLCADTCHYSLANPEDPAMLPAAKIEQITSLYRRYHTLLGRMMPKWVGARELDQERVEKLIDAVFGRCTMCGRCGLNCSIGLHAGQIIRAARTVLAEVGLVPKSLQSTVDTAVRTGNNMAISENDFVETIEWLQDDLRLETGVKTITIPLDKSGVNILYTLNPREPKFFPLSITAAAKVFYAANENWTLSRHNFDVTNYALFSGNDKEARQIAERLIIRTKEMGAQVLAMAECGHGFRATRWEAANWTGGKLGVPVKSVLEVFAAYVKEGRLKLDPSKNSKRVTLHDPCNLVRNGGVIEEQRYILKHAVQDFVEMIPNRKQNFCCGGGGGMLAMGEYKERRIKAGKIKADQIKATGAKIVATPCHNCIDQLMELNDHYKLGVEIKTVTEVLAEAVILDKP